MSELRHRRVKVSDEIELAVTEAGPADGPLVVCLHGFPETSHSWRHTLPALGAAGWHAIAPDLRGYATSSRPASVDDYGTDALSADVLGVLDDRGSEQAVFVGHDWGALLMWDLARLHPERCRALVGVSVPQLDWLAPPLDVFRLLAGDRFMYIVYFQEVGPAEAELEADVRRSLRTVLWGASAEGLGHAIRDLPSGGTRWFDTFGEPPAELPAWLTEADLDAYTDALATSGFFGPLSYYRNMDANYERVRDLPLSRLAMPVWFIAGDHEPVLMRDKRGIERMRTTLPDYRGETIIPGVGHWTQQEAPEAFNAALLGYLASL